MLICASTIFTYGGRGTTKPGVIPDEHAIMYSSQYSPRLLQGETVLSKMPIPVVMNHGVRALSASSRVYFALHHPIQYNVKVMDVGYVHPDWLPYLLAYAAQESGMLEATPLSLAPTAPTVPLDPGKSTIYTSNRQ
jgi:hypothetical protein